MAAVDTKFYEKKKQQTFYMSLGFLLWVIIGTLALYLYLGGIQTKTDELQTRLSWIETSISSIESNDQIQLYSMYQTHKTFFTKMGEVSEIPLFVSHLKKQFTKYGIQAKGFAYDSKNGVSIELSAQTNESGYAYQKIVKFLREYALDENAIFSVGMISNFSWYDRINYEGTFLLK